MTSVFKRKFGHRLTYAQGEDSMKRHGKNATLRQDWSDVSTRQGMPGVAGKSPNARKRQGRKPTGFRGSVALLTP